MIHMSPWHGIFETTTSQGQAIMRTKTLVNLLRLSTYSKLAMFSFIRLIHLWDILFTLSTEMKTDTWKQNGTCKGTYNSSFLKCVKKKVLHPTCGCPD